MTGPVTIGDETGERVIRFTSAALAALAEPVAPLRVIETAAYQSTCRTG